MPEPVDGETLRQVMRRVPSPVTVVTAANAQEARGITIGSFTSVALEPPLICFNVNHDAQMHGVILEAPRFAVHVLSEAQAPLANHFAVPDRTGPEQFRTVPHTINEHGTPVLEDATAVLHCVHHDVFTAGDKSIIVGRVVDVETATDGGAVLYYKRTYRRVGDELRSTRLSPVKRVSNDTS
jgi:flavin reductase (DIM6/NTAB) family NADH-FMN oxidoreductase RutF